VLAAVFIPTAFIPGITGRLYQQFAVTIAVSMLISAFNALTLSPALSAMLLKPKKKGRGLLQRFFDWFNRVFGVATDKFVTSCHFLVRKSLVAILILVGFVFLTSVLGKRIPGSFLPTKIRVTSSPRSFCPTPPLSSAPMESCVNARRF
jgi:HAE1 family hydrophobic/amphiphilic exporter-1